MAAIGADHLDAEGELVDDVIDEVDGVGLVVPGVDLDGPNAGGVVDGGVLVALNGGPFSALNERNLTSIWM